MHALTRDAAIRTIPVALGERSYEVAIGPGLLAEAGGRIARALPGARLAIVADEAVANLHLDALMRSLAAAGVAAVPIPVPPGEGSKSWPQLERVAEAIVAARLERGDAVAAFGGGVVGDLAGFVAAIVRRGMRLVQIPTTLLAQVDSSVGGKTGINSHHGKNLIGAFHQPRLVLADLGVLDTLPPREFAAGYAEIVKYGLIDDAPFFAWLDENRAAIFSGGAQRGEAIAHSVATKARVVAEDETEQGARALLNLGHTFGHALEAFHGYDPARLVHGEAVAVGLVLAHEFSAALGLAPPDDVTRVRAHLSAAGLPTRIQDIPGPRPAADDLMRAIAQDKKVKGGALTFILTRGIGRAFVARDVAPERVRAFLAERTGE